MNEPIKKQPVDELFARKLTTLSSSPDRQGFARLQARIEQKKQPEKVVFWRTATFQRSVAAAACLALLATLGWHKQSVTVDETTANAQKTIARSAQTVRPVELAKLEGLEVIANLAKPDRSADNAGRNANKNTEKIADYKRGIVEVAVVANSKYNKSTAKTSIIKATSANDVTERKDNDEQLASFTTPASVEKNVTNIAVAAAPRTLVVTIAEPDVLVAAKQTAQEADQKLVVVNKNTNETGAGKLWRKIQQIRSGETAVANAPADEDEKGLLDRAYSGIKQSFQKNKPVRQ